MTYQEFQQQYQDVINQIWSNMSVDSQGGVYMHFNNQNVKYENLRYINKDGKSFIHDNASGKLYDQMFNYYYDGNYYNPFGQLVQEVDNPNIIDGEFRDVTNEPSRSAKPKYKATRGPKLKEKETQVEDVVDEITDSKPRKRYKATRGPKLKQKAIDPPSQLPAVIEKALPTKTLSEGGQEAIEHAVKKLPGGKGKAIALLVGAMTVGMVGNAITDKKKEKPQTQRSFDPSIRRTYDAPISDPQAMQMAQAMSQYRYGSRLPGFN